MRKSQQSDIWILKFCIKAKKLAATLDCGCCEAWGDCHDQEQSILFRKKLFAQDELFRLG